MGRRDRWGTAADYPAGLTDSNFDRKLHAYYGVDAGLDDSFEGCDPDCESEGTGDDCCCFERHQDAYQEAIEAQAEDRADQLADQRAEDKADGPR